MQQQKPLRILHVFRAPVGGLFRHVMDVARGQIERGHQVGIVCDSTTGGERAETALAALADKLEIGLHRVPMPRNPGPGDLGCLSAIQRIVRQQNLDVLHGHGSKGGLYIRLPAVFTNHWPATVYTPHGGSFHFRTSGLRDRLYRTAERFLAKHTSLFLMESAYIAELARIDLAPLKAPMRIVPNGLAPHEFDPVVQNSDARDVLYLGEMRALKGVDTLLLALAKLAELGQPVTALLVGAGPDDAVLKQQAHDLGLADRVTFQPPMPIREALKQAKLMVVPSRNESLPYVVLEAAAAAMPLVATNVGGIPEIFGPQRQRLIEPDDAAVLAKAISAALSGQFLADPTSLAAYVREHFSYDRMVDGGLAAYREAMG